MDPDFDDTVVRGLHRYVRLVSQALGLPGESFYVQADPAMSVYLAVEGRLTRYPHRDVALLWDEAWGWTAAIETHSGEDLLVVACLDQSTLPAPTTVARWVRGLFTGVVPTGTPVAAPVPTESTRRRLVVYAAGDVAAEPHVA